MNTRIVTYDLELSGNKPRKIALAEGSTIVDIGSRHSIPTLYVQEVVGDRAYKLFDFHYVIIQPGDIFDEEQIVKDSGVPNGELFYMNTLNMNEYKIYIVYSIMEGVSMDENVIEALNTLLNSDEKGVEVED